MTQKHYCIYCGSSLEEGSNICPSCKQPVPEKESLFKEYLYRNTKEKLKSTIDDSFFNIVKNWILSHLYGVVVSLLIVGLAVRALALPGLPSYIKEMNSSERPVQAIVSQEEQQSQQQPQPSQEQEITREDLREITDVSSQFQHAVFYETLVSRNGDSGGFREPEKPSADYLLPASYGGVTQNDFYIVLEYKASKTDYDFDHITTNDPATDTGKRLLSEGYPVAEITCLNTYHDELSDDAPAVRTDTFVFVLAKVNGNWYIAETKALN